MLIKSFLKKFIVKNLQPHSYPYSNNQPTLVGMVHCSILLAVHKQMIHKTYSTFLPHSSFYVQIQNQWAVPCLVYPVLVIDVHDGNFNVRLYLPMVLTAVVRFRLLDRDGQCALNGYSSWHGSNRKITSSLDFLWFSRYKMQKWCLEHWRFLLTLNSMT